VPWAGGPTERGTTVGAGLNVGGGLWAGGLTVVASCAAASCAKTPSVTATSAHRVRREERHKSGMALSFRNSGSVDGRHGTPQQACAAARTTLAPTYLSETARTIVCTRRSVRGQFTSCPSAATDTNGAANIPREKGRRFSKRRARDTSEWLLYAALLQRRARFRRPVAAGRSVAVGAPGRGLLRLRGDFHRYLRSALCAGLREGHARRRRGFEGYSRSELAQQRQGVRAPFVKPTRDSRAGGRRFQVHSE